MERITIDCPDDLLVALGTTADQFQEEAKFALAAKLYELGRYLPVSPPGWLAWIE
jgi:hypothetical protein